MKYVRNCSFWAVFLSIWGRFEGFAAMWWLYKFLDARVPETEFMYPGNLDPWRLNERSSNLKVIAADGSLMLPRIASAGEVGRLRYEILNVTTGQRVSWEVSGP